MDICPLPSKQIFAQCFCFDNRPPSANHKLNPWRLLLAATDSKLKVRLETGALRKIEWRDNNFLMFTNKLILC
jgi:hypothetical protein